jgi:hypothetical protein
MATMIEVTIKQTITRVVRFETSYLSRTDIKKQVEAYGVTEAFSDFPEDENKGSIETIIVKIEKVK